MYEDHHHSHAAGQPFLAGILFGVAMGAAVGLLFAPMAGADTRQRVADGASRLRKAAGRRYDDASAVAHDAMEKGRRAWQRGVEKFDETRAAHDAGADAAI